MPVELWLSVHFDESDCIAQVTKEKKRLIDFYLTILLSFDVNFQL